MRPFHSKLNPHFDLIRSLRRHRKTWKQIVDELAGLGMTTCQSAVLEFYKRHSKRPCPIGWEDEEQKPFTGPRSASVRIEAITLTEAKPRRFTYDPQANDDLIH